MGINMRDHTEYHEDDYKNDTEEFIERIEKGDPSTLTEFCMAYYGMQHLCLRSIKQREQDFPPPASKKYSTVDIDMDMLFDFIDQQSETIRNQDSELISWCVDRFNLIRHHWFLDLDSSPKDQSLNGFVLWDGYVIYKIWVSFMDFKDIHEIFYDYRFIDQVLRIKPKHIRVKIYKLWGLT